MSLVIKLVRHGESLGNVGALNFAEVGDHTIGLTPLGKEQAFRTGEKIGSLFIDGALTYCSPFRRTRETLACVLDGAGVLGEKVRVYEDPRLREVEHGYEDVAAQDSLRRTHGWFYYRFRDGESPADCYDRTSGFLESLMRQVERKQAKRTLVVTHSLTIRCFVMRFLHLTVEQFELMASPANADVITLAPKDEIESPVFTSGRWGSAGYDFATHNRHQPLGKVRPQRTGTREKPRAVSLSRRIAAGRITSLDYVEPDLPPTTATDREVLGSGGSAPAAIEEDIRATGCLYRFGTSGSQRQRCAPNTRRESALADPERAADFVMEVAEESPDAALR